MTHLFTFRTQLCINTAIVYLHRFYMFHSFTKFHRNPIASCALFLAAKVEEQPRKLEHVIRVAHMLLFPNQRQLDISSEVFSHSYIPSHGSLTSHFTPSNMWNRLRSWSIMKISYSRHWVLMWPLIIPTLRCSNAASIYSEVFTFNRRYSK